jgi:hypothetical protein
MIFAGVVLVLFLSCEHINAVDTSNPDFALAYNESDGFWNDIPEKAWKKLKARHAAMPNYLYKTGLPANPSVWYQVRVFTFPSQLLFLTIVDFTTFNLRRTTLSQLSPVCMRFALEEWVTGPSGSAILSASLLNRIALCTVLAQTMISGLRATSFR